MSQTKPETYELLTEKEAAGMLKISVHKMRQDRVKGTGMRFCRLGRCVRYRLSDVQAFIESHTFQSTSEAER